MGICRKGTETRSITVEHQNVTHEGVIFDADVDITYTADFAVTNYNHDCAADYDMPDESDYSVTDIRIEKITVYDDNGNDSEIFLTKEEELKLKKELECRAEKDFYDNGDWDA